jgi:hypothetical protein
MESTIAVFHQREHMQEAVRDLTEHGFERENISVRPTRLKGHAETANPMRAMPQPVHVAGIGAALGMIIGLAIATPGAGGLLTLWTVIIGAVLGGLIGASVGALLTRRRARRAKTGAEPRDWLVRVDTASSVEAEHVEQALRRHGGDIVPAT